MLTLIRAKDLVKPLKPLFGSLAQRADAALVFRSARKRRAADQFQLPFNGRIHFLGTHIHPHGVSIALYNVTRRTGLDGTRKSGADGPMQVYSNRRRLSGSSRRDLSDSSGVRESDGRQDRCHGRTVHAIFA